MLAKVLGVFAAIGGVLVLFLRGQLHKERAERSEQDIKRAEAVQKQSDKATEALIRGMENESKPVNGRTHDFNG